MFQRRYRMNYEDQQTALEHFCQRVLQESIDLYRHVPSSGRLQKQQSQTEQIFGRLTFVPSIKKQKYYIMDSL